MTTSIRKPIVVALVALFVLLLGSTASAVEYVLVTAKDKSAAKAMTKEDVNNIYTGKTKTWGGTSNQVWLIMPKSDSSELQWLCESVLGIAPGVFMRLSLENTFRGRINRPIMARDSADAVKLVGSKAGAVTVIPRSALTGDLKIVYP